MKKLIGCLAVFGLFVIASLIAGYFLVVRPVKAMSDDIQAAIAEFREVGELDAQVRNTDEFEAPKDGLLTEEQVTRFAAVATAVHEASDTRVEALRAKYDALAEDARDNTGIRAIANFRPGIAVEAFGDLADMWRTAKEAQVAALNAQGFSLSEYGWVRTEFYRAFGMAITPINLSDLTDLDLNSLEDLENLQNLPGLPTTDGKVEPPTVSAPSENAALIEPYRDQIDEWVQFAVLGL